MKKVRGNNPQEFINDFKRVRDIMAISIETAAFFKIRKLDVWETAQQKKIRYYLTDKVFANRRTVMVIL